MSCVVGVAHQGSVYIGSDSVVVSGETYTTTSQKVFPVGHLLVGVQGNARLADLVRSRLHEYIDRVQAIHQLPSPSDWLRVEFVRAITPMLLDGGLLRTEDGGVQKSCGSLLVGLGGSLWTVFSDLAVVECPAEGYAIGSGREAARGSLHTSRELLDDPASRVRLALEAAEATITNVRGPHRVWRLQGGHVEELPSDRGVIR